MKSDRVNIMTALSACNHWALAPTQTAKPSPRQKSNSLNFVDHPNGTITAYKSGAPVAWIVAGHHHGQVNKQPHTCTFVDVAYHRQTQRGVNLETFEADTIEQALQALNILFSDLPVATQHAELIRLFAPDSPQQSLPTNTLKARNPFTSPAVEVAA